MASILLLSDKKSPSDLDDSLTVHCAGSPVVLASQRGVAWRRHSPVTVRSCLTPAADQPHVAVGVVPRLGLAVSPAQFWLLEREERFVMDSKVRVQRNEATYG